MYCTNCGKQINYNSPVCVECARAAEAKANGGWQNGAQNGAYQQNGGNTYENYYSFEPISPDIFGAGQNTSYGTGRSGQQQPAGNGGNYYKQGLGRSIVAAVLAQLAVLFITTFLEEELGVLMAGMIFVALPCAIVGLCLGIASIKCFREARRTATGLPIPTLIIGIHAVVNASLALLLCLASFALV